MRQHLETISWAIQLLDTGHKRRSLKAGSQFFAEKDNFETPSKTPESPLPLLRGDSFKPILANLADEFELMVSTVELLAGSQMRERKFVRADDTEEIQEAEKIKEKLQSNLYTKRVSDGFSSVAKSPWQAVKKRQKAMEVQAETMPEKPKLKRTNSDPQLSTEAG
eukprot:CAMPEP_0197696584 /NCGR_PEP_ID=MMETSP1338-20131121/116821_1 /TAXON_ID=43686 ORGANISM="Pelagodinium beii, Strain RCC1491" /NCGR_SAMPLE_ID=MMETSP1338 /ASSEMBLY_ACC=CAM_ASM_000754 /LENGTH=164 /DNA_ID=CAMNT_0043279713 /DNA_START=53 /DNA_END=544 /DNA_ORIENTATION=-